MKLVSSPVSLTPNAPSRPTTSSSISETSSPTGGPPTSPPPGPDRHTPFAARSTYSGKQLLLSGRPGSVRTGDCGHIVWVDISRPSVSTNPPDAASISFQAICDSKHVGLATYDYGNDVMAASLHDGNSFAGCQEGIEERPIANADQMTKSETLCAETDEYAAATTWTGGGVTTATLTITAWRKPTS